MNLPEKGLSASPASFPSIVMKGGKHPSSGWVWSTLAADYTVLFREKTRSPL